MLSQRELISSITAGMPSHDAERCATALTAALQTKSSIPPSTVAGVLHQFDVREMYSEGLELYRTVIQPLYPQVDSECISTVVLRLQSKNQSSSADTFDTILQTAETLRQKGTLKRRFFTEPLKALSERAVKDQAAVSLAFDLIQFGLKHDIEFWDQDFVYFFSALVHSSHVQREHAKRLGEQIIRAGLLKFHPIVGRQLASLIQELFSNRTTSAAATDASSVAPRSDPVDASGVCQHCHHKLLQFDLENTDRVDFLRSIEERLIVPSLRHFQQTGSHKGFKPAMASVKLKDPQAPVDMSRFHQFTLEIEKTVQTASLNALPKPVCILDGANIGYFNVASWYKKAKLEVLQAKGIDPTTLPPSAFEHSARKGLAMDVPLRFSNIDAAVQSVLERQWLPLVILHERHLSAAHLTKQNAAFVDKWASLSESLGHRIMFSSPSSLNDDFCWLYASVKHGCYVATNDLMRDHHFATLSQRHFLRWRERFRLSFSIFHPPRQAERGDGVFRLNDPPAFSVWIQPVQPSSGTEGGSDAKPSQGTGNPKDREEEAHRFHWHIPFYAHVDIVDQGTNEVKSEEETEAMMADLAVVSWVCTVP